MCCKNYINTDVISRKWSLTLIALSMIKCIISILIHYEMFGILETVNYSSHHPQERKEMHTTLFKGKSDIYCLVKTYSHMEMLTTEFNNYHAAE